ncbi:hypothetical protein SLE2022_248190 [Rubroshorea leprosula]
MDRYQKVERRKPEAAINENEIRITSAGPIRNYISYATSLLQDKHVKEIVLKAMGQAISKTVAIAEIIKKRMPRLHQDTAISSVSITDVWEPIEEGLENVEMTRQVSMISITFSFRELNQNSPGYQAPNYVEKPQNRYQQQQPPKQARIPYNAGNQDSYGQDSYGRGRSRGRGRGRGWARAGYGNHQDNARGGYGNYQDNPRGGYGNYQDNARGGYGNYQDNGGYSNWGRGGGRGRGWSNRGGYERGRGGGGRGYGRSRGRMGGRSRGGGY